MAARSTAAPEKRPGFFSQLRTLYTFTQKAFPWLPLMLIGMVLLGIAAGVGVGFLIPPIAVWSIILWGVTGLMAGVLAGLCPSLLDVAMSGIDGSDRSSIDDC